MPRLFFALIPDDLVRQQIAKVSAQLPLGGNKVKAANFHATLLSLGQIPEQQIQPVKDVAEKILVKPFDIYLDSREWWKKSSLTCMGASKVPKALNELVTALADAIQPLEIDIEPRPFHIHITLMNNVHKPINHLTFKAIPWLVRGFSLVASEQVSGETEYRVIQTWDFVG